MRTGTEETMTETGEKDTGSPPRGAGAEIRMGTAQTASNQASVPPGVHFK